jgi:hypothetical protein
MTGRKERDMPLNTDFNLGTKGDGLFNDLLNAHNGLTDDESSQLNAAIILLLSNHIGDAAVIRDAITQARASLDS